MFVLGWPKRSFGFFQQSYRKNNWKIRETNMMFTEIILSHFAHIEESFVFRDKIQDPVNVLFIH